MSSQTSKKSLGERLDLLMQWNFPQTETHSGDMGIKAIDEETGGVWISLTGTYSECGISPMTIQALKVRMVAELEKIDATHASTGGSYDDEPGAGLGPNVSDASF